MSAPAERINRTDHAAFVGHLEALVGARRSPPQLVGLLLIEIRDFGRLNSSFGYSAGDAAIAELASRLVSSFVRQGNVVRIGASRFALVLTSLKSPAAWLACGQEGRAAVRAACRYRGRAITLRLAQGLSFWPEQALSGAELLKLAEIALGDARKSDAGIARFDPERLHALRQSLHAEAALEAALQEGGIEPYFQAQVCVATGRPCGAEALLRCQDESGAFVSPEAIVQVAERTGQLTRVTAGMLNAALRHLTDWSQYVESPRVAVNVSTQSLTQDGLVDSVVSALRVWNARAEDLTIEVTESALMVEPEKSFETLRALRALGVRVAIDDFGTGYSSLSYFKNIPANELKVDKSFVSSMCSSSVDYKIVRVVTELAHAFNLEVVAEGVEDQAALQLLAEMGCDVVQGYLFSKPLPATDFRAWLKNTSAVAV